MHIHSCWGPSRAGQKAQTNAIDYVLKADYDALEAELAATRKLLPFSAWELGERAKALEADRDQISLTLAVAKADRDKWFNRARDLEKALAKANALGHQNVKPDFAQETAVKPDDETCTSCNGTGWDKAFDRKCDCQ